MNPDDCVIVHTDGACSGNPGPGGWGVVLRYRDTVRELSGGQPETTNNRMEMLAVIEALRALKRSVPVKVYTDSQYVKNGIGQWIRQWKQNGWKTSARQPVKNVDLWQTLDGLVSQHRIEWHWVKGHSGNPDNERADALARAGILSLKK